MQRREEMALGPRSVGPPKSQVGTVGSVWLGIGIGARGDLNMGSEKV
jgi:hypothetical protein